MTSMNLPLAITSLSTGIIATVILDLWALTLNRLFGLPVTNWGRVGRWVAGLLPGSYRQDTISAPPAMACDQVIGWSTHYLVGITYAAIYLVGLNLLSRTPDPTSALLFGIATVLAPWLILQPGLGLGYFGSRTPKPKLTRTLNLVSHSVFGFGLFIGWRLVSLVA